MFFLRSTGVNVHAILKANEKVLKPDDFNWLPESGINRLINISNRTIDGLNYTIDYIRENRNKISKDYLGLIDVQSKIDIKGGLNARGFAILDNDGKLIEKRAVIIDEKRPIWFVFNGLGMLNIFFCCSCCCKHCLSNWTACVQVR